MKANLEKASELSFTNSDQNRLDKVLVLQLPDHSRSRLQNLIRQGNVSVDGIPITKSGFALAGGEEIQIIIPAPKSSKLIPENIPLDIIFEDSNVVLVNKAAGMVVHPSVGHSSGTLMHAVLAHAPDIQGVGGELRPGLVHRLDRDTSGLIILAKNDKTHGLLQGQFADRQVEKTYSALVEGHPPTSTGRVEAPIGRDPHNRKKMAVLPEGKGREAFTEYHVLESFSKQSLLEIDLLTGRTHQIRVHMAFLGCPVVGDKIYGKRKTALSIDRQFLHASVLVIRLPGERIARRFQAPLPNDLTLYLKNLRGHAAQ